MYKSIVYKNEVTTELCKFIFFLHTCNFILFIHILRIWGQSWHRGISITVNATGCGFDSHSKNLIFIFFRSGVEAKPGVQFCYTTCNAFRVQQKARNSSKGLNGKKCLSTRFPLLALMCAGYNVKLKNKYIYNAL